MRVGNADYVTELLLYPRRLYHYDSRNRPDNPNPRAEHAFPSVRMQQDLKRDPCAFHFLLIPRASGTKSVTLRSLIHNCEMATVAIQKSNKTVTLFRFTETDGGLFVF
jgi:hypothetical protein